MKLKTETWRCDECGEQCKLVVEIGEEDYYESRTADICESCLRKAIELITNKERNE